MIRRYSEPRLAALVMTSVLIFAAAYLVIGLIGWIPSGSTYGILPSISIGFGTTN